MTQHIPLEQIIPNPEQPRRYFEPEALAGLAQSLKRKQIQPIAVEEVRAGLYMLHDGERRWRAAKLAGLATIEAVVRPSLNGDPGAPRKQERLLDALIANVQRVDLDPIEEAQSLGSLRATGLTINQIADKTGMAHVTVSARLRLLDLEEEIQQLIAQGQLPRDRRVADALLAIEDRETRVKLATRLGRPGITIPTIVNACQRLNERRAQERQMQIKQTPALALAGGKAPAQGSAKWRDVRAAAQGMCEKCDANPHLGNVPEPAWTLIIQASQQTCEACSMRQAAINAQLMVCKECPAVELLKRLTGDGHVG